MDEQQQDLLGDSSYSADLAEHLDQVPVDLKKKWPEALSAILAIYERELADMKLEPEQARKISLRLVLAQSEYGGGRYFYLPRGDKLKQAVRDYNVFTAWVNGASIDSLAIRYNLTVQRIYSIVGEQRTLDIQRRQPELF